MENRNLAKRRSPAKLCSIFGFLRLLRYGTVACSWVQLISPRGAILTTLRLCYYFCYAELGEVLHRRLFFFYGELPELRHSHQPPSPSTCTVGCVTQQIRKSSHMAVHANLRSLFC
jgi:hypothetical protein